MARQRAFAALSMPTQRAAPAMPRSLQPPRTLSRRPERRREMGVAFLAAPGQRILKEEDASATAPQKRAAQKDAAAKRKKRWK